MQTTSQNVRLRRGWLIALLLISFESIGFRLLRFRKRSSRSTSISLARAFSLSPYHIAGSRRLWRTNNSYGRLLPYLERYELAFTSYRRNEFVEYSFSAVYAICCSSKQMMTNGIGHCIFKELQNVLFVTFTSIASMKSTVAFFSYPGHSSKS